MKRLFAFLLLVLAIAGSVYWMANYRPSESQILSLEEVFLSLPKEAFTIMVPDDPAWRQELLDKKRTPHFLKSTWDPKSGVFQFQSMSDGGGVYYTVFFQSQGTLPYAFVNQTEWGMCCESSELKIFERRHGRWFDVSKAKLQMPKIGEYFANGKVPDFVLEEFLQISPTQIDIDLKSLAEGESLGFSAKLDLGEVMYDFEQDKNKIAAFKKAFLKKGFYYVWKKGRFVRKRSFELWRPEDLEWSQEGEE